jgi:3-deoxy-D-manno-octulosonate 8-phosphate phosphatase (KDO 8-P phosphatase)
MKKIKLLVMDVDGTLTDGKIHIGVNGEVMKSFDVKDGYGIANILPLYKIIPVIITGRKSEIVEKRAAELNIKYVFQGIKDKEIVLREICENLRCNLSEVAYIGDDLNDLNCLQKCGVSACPNDAIEQIKDIVDFVSSRKGGEGAVREIIEWIEENCL